MIRGRYVRLHGTALRGPGNPKESSMTRRASILVLVLALPPSAASAQEPPSIKPGTRVRVWTSTTAEPVIGKVISQDGITLALASDGAAPSTFVVRDSIIRIDVGHRRSRGRNALYGALICGGIGALVGAAGANPEAFLWNDRSEGAAFFGLIGAPVGALIGLAARPGPEKWTTTMAPPMRTARAIAVRAPSLRISFRF